MLNVTLSASVLKNAIKNEGFSRVGHVVMVYKGVKNCRFGPYEGVSFGFPRY